MEKYKIFVIDENQNKIEIDFREEIKGLKKLNMYINFFESKKRSKKRDVTFVIENENGDNVYTEDSKPLKEVG